MFRRTTGIIADIVRQADLVLLGLCCAATAYGLVMITSATRFLETYRQVIVQGAAALIGIGLYFLASMVDVTELVKKWKWILLFNVGFILLLKTPLGLEVNGNLAWLDIPGVPVNIQPAEIVKLTFIILLAYQLVWLKDNRDLKSTSSIMMLGGHLLLIVGLYYVISSDMGSALVYIFVFACMAFVAGTAIRWFVMAILGGGIAFYLLWQEDMIPQYMKDRFIVLVDHDYRPMNEGWHQTRSLLALGSGGILGQGYLNGTQTQSPYSTSLPERHTEPVQFTVKSLRLDAAAAGLFHLSRTSAAEEIRLGNVSVNGYPCLKGDAPVTVGMYISMRGYGKGQITEVGGQSRKGRIFVRGERLK